MTSWDGIWDWGDTINWIAVLTLIGKTNKIIVYLNMNIIKRIKEFWVNRHSPPFWEMKIIWWKPTNLDQLTSKIFISTLSEELKGFSHSFIPDHRQCERHTSIHLINSSGYDLFPPFHSFRAIICSGNISFNHYN